MASATADRVVGVERVPHWRPNRDDAGRWIVLRGRPITEDGTTPTEWARAYLAGAKVSGPSPATGTAKRRQVAA